MNNLLVADFAFKTYTDDSDKYSRLSERYQKKKKDDDVIFRILCLLLKCVRFTVPHYSIESDDG